MEWGRGSGRAGGLIGGAAPADYGGTVARAGAVRVAVAAGEGGLAQELSGLYTYVGETARFRHTYVHVSVLVLMIGFAFSIDFSNQMCGAGGTPLLTFIESKNRVHR